MMSELEMSQKLGLVLEPTQNRIAASNETIASVVSLLETFREHRTQAEWSQDLYTDMWLEFVPWHSDN
jgi:hypothetical protein